MKYGLLCIILEYLKKLVNLCRTITNEKYAVIKVGRKITNIIDMEKGVRQGDGIAPVLFNIALEIAIRRSKIQTNGTIFTKSQQILAYADDLVLTSRRIQDLEEIYIELEKQTKMLGLKINIQKSKYMNVTKKAAHQRTIKYKLVYIPLIK